MHRLKWGCSVGSDQHHTSSPDTIFGNESLYSSRVRGICGVILMTYSYKRKMKSQCTLYLDLRIHAGSDIYELRCGCAESAPSFCGRALQHLGIAFVYRVVSAL